MMKLICNLLISAGFSIFISAASAAGPDSNIRAPVLSSIMTIQVDEVFGNHIQIEEKPILNTM